MESGSKKALSRRRFRQKATFCKLEQHLDPSSGICDEKSRTECALTELAGENLALCLGSRPSFSGEALRPNPEAGQGSQVALVGARDGVFFSTLDPERVLSRCPRLNLFNVGTVHDHGTMNSDESVWF